MLNKHLTIFKREKNNSRRGIEYILCTNERPTLMSSNLKGIASYVSILTKRKPRLGVVYSIPDNLNGGYSYSNLNLGEKSKIDDYLSPKKIKKYSFETN